MQTDANGLLHMRARYYNPYLMRFLNPDPIGFSGGSNWFAFADGNPISKLDPFGPDAALMFGWHGFGQTYDPTSNPAAGWPPPGVVPFVQGVGVGIAGAVVTTGAAFGAVAIGVPTAVVTGSLYVLGVVGGASAVVSVARDPSADNVGYNLGALTGGAIVGGVAAKPLGRVLSPLGHRQSIETSKLSDEINMMWRDGLGGPKSLSALFRDFPKAMETGPTFGGAIGAVALGATGASNSLGSSAPRPIK